MSGKTQIAVELTKQLNLSYFKNTGEWTSDLRTPDYFKNLLIYGGTFMADFVEQVKPNVVFDRCYPSEWVYSQYFNRDSNEQILKKIDEKYAKAGAKIIICRRKSFDGIQDDLHSYLDSKALIEIDQLYEKFISWTKCEVMTLWVDDENLEREVSEIRSWLKQ